MLDILLGRWEWESCQLLRHVVRPGMTVVDVGANVGLYTRLFSRLVTPSGRVVAFEPDPGTFALLKRNTAGLGNVEVVEAAVSNASGRAVLYRNRWSDTLNSLRPGPDHDETMEVKTVRLDDFFSGKPPPAVIKIDVEGAEPLVLQGMGKCLAGPEFRGVLVEYCPGNYRTSGLKASDIFACLPNCDAHAVVSTGLRQVDSPDELPPLFNRHGYVNCWFMPRSKPN